MLHTWPLWECLFLTLTEIDELLAFLATRRAPPWFRQMILFAAHTGARRSEMIRAKAEDVDLANRVVTLHEKKRVRGSLTTRRVPLSDSLSEALADWLPGRSFLFGQGDRPLSVQATQKAFARAFRDTKWSVLKGYHSLRRSFISALASKGIDQRLIDEWCGHCTESMRRRHRHLYPSVQADAIRSAFG